LAWLQDAARWDATKFLGTLKISGKLVPVRSDRAAHDASVKIITGMPGSVVPWPVVGHWAFNTKEPLIVIGDDEEKRCGWISVGRGWISDDSQVGCGHSASIRLK
jgi:hypothetical protein